MACSYKSILLLQLSKDSTSGMARAFLYIKLCRSADMCLHTKANFQVKRYCSYFWCCCNVLSGLHPLGTVRAGFKKYCQCPWMHSGFFFYEI